jgi:RNA polymerase sigma-70 factor (ECF subfamily)
MAERENSDLFKPCGRNVSAEELAEGLSKLLEQFLLNRFVDAHDVPDMVQRVFLRAVKDGGYRGGVEEVETSPYTWVVSLARYELATYQRRQAVSLERFADAEGMEDVADERTGVSSATRRVDLVNALLGGIDEELVTPYVMYEIEEKPCDEIAALLGLPVGTVYSRLHRARAQLFKLAAELLPERARTSPKLRKK